MPDSPSPEALFVRLYFDRHIMTRLAIDLRGRGFDVLTTEEARKDTASDEEQRRAKVARSSASTFAISLHSTSIGRQRIELTPAPTRERCSPATLAMLPLGVTLGNLRQSTGLTNTLVRWHNAIVASSEKTI
jgi:hypothetical protein